MEHSSVLRKQAYLQTPDGELDLNGFDQVFEMGDLVAYLKPHRAVGLGVFIDEPGLGSIRVWSLSVFSGKNQVADASFSEFRFANGLSFEDAIYVADSQNEEIYKGALLAVDLAERSGSCGQFEKNFRLLSIVWLKIADAARGQLVWKAPLHAAIDSITRAGKGRATYWLAYQALPLIPENLSSEHRIVIADTIRTPRCLEALRRIYARHIGVDQIVNDSDDRDGWMVRKLSSTSKRNPHA